MSNTGIFSRDRLNLPSRVNDEYLRVLEKSQAESISLVEQQDLETEISVLNLAIERTNDNALKIDNLSDFDFQVTQIGDYQIWRDRDELAIIDLSEDRLITLSKIPSTLKPKKSIAKQEDRLIDKVIRNYPNIVLQEDEDSLLKADGYFTELKEEQWESERILLHETPEFFARQIYLKEGAETAEVLAQYLEGDNLEREKSGFELSYNPQNQILTFEDLDGSSDSFSAQKIGDRWHPLNNSDWEKQGQEIINHQEIVKRLERSAYQQKKNKSLSQKPIRLSY